MSLKKSVLSLVCCVMLCAGLTLSVSAAAPEFSDLPTDHWAYGAMIDCVGMGVMSGTGEGTMSPDATLNWGQFLTMISRAANPRAYIAKLEKGIPWDQAGYELAREEGLLKRNDGLLDIDEDELDRPITRLEVAVLVSRFIPEEALWHRSMKEFPFQDADHLSKQERDILWTLYDNRVISGKGEGMFCPDDILKRSEGAVMLRGAIWQKDWEIDDLVSVDVTFVDPDGAVVAAYDSVPIRNDVYSCWLFYERPIEGYTIGKETSYEYITTACCSYVVQIRRMTELERMEREAEERYERGEITEEEYLNQEFWLYHQGHNDAKDAFAVRRFASAEQASAAMARVTVPIWKLSGGQKISSTATITVQTPLAPMVERIFTEIYNDPEQFPFNSIGGYAWRGSSSSSEHCSGTAIDLNPNENYQVSEGRAMVGSFWKPGENPYSITPGGSVVRAFEKYGWSWGGDAWSWDTDVNEGYHDFMHFSYFGG